MSTDERREGGFEYDGRFYPWRWSEMGKDLMLVDRIAGMGLLEFGDAAGEGLGQMRPAVILTLIATSLRAGNPDWSVQRIVSTVENLDWTKDLSLIAGQEDEPNPPAEEPTPAPAGSSRSPSNGSSSSPTPTDNSTSEAWSEIPV